MLSSHDEKSNSINWQKIAFVPMAILVFAFVVLLICFGIWEGSRLNLQAKKNLSIIIVDQESALVSELYFGQTNAIRVRLKSIIESIYSSSANHGMVCVGVFDKREQSAIRPITSCSDGLQFNLDENTSTVKLVAGTDVIGEVRYYFVPRALILTYFSAELSIALLMALLIALLVSMFFAKTIERRLILPSIMRLVEMERKSKILEAQSNFAKQVSHDIRSPLSALNMVMTTLKDVPEEKRLLIRNAVQRINDIANDLLAKSKKNNSEFINRSGNNLRRNELILLPALIDRLVSEKRIQYRDKINVKIEADLRESFGDFIVADGKEIMRLLSNLINNSIESFKNNHGEVFVNVHSEVNYIKVIIKDNGFGIPEYIIAKLGEVGVTFGKEGSESGSGLGIHHAKKYIGEIGGQFKINSIVDVGTSIEIILPKADTPDWFLTNISLKSNTQILCLDDDITIHQIWKNRFSDILLKFPGIKMKNFTSSQDFKNFVELNFDMYESCLFLIDYELLGQSQNGLNIIESLDISSNSILVTSRYEEPDIVKRCIECKVKMIPKSLAGFIPIKVM